MIRRKKPLFFRQGWYKQPRVGKTVKKKRKWRAAKGGDSKIRLRERGKAARPSPGWGSDHRIRDKVQGLNVVRIETEKQFANITDKKNTGIIIAAVGKKKKKELIKKANELGFKVLNKYHLEIKNAISK